jgi:hypothetical protein
MLPNLVLIIGSVSYDNIQRGKLPTSNASEAEMKTWLVEGNIIFSDSM